MTHRIPASLATFVAVWLVLALALPAGNAGAAGPLAGKTVCLDPGHGGADPGAVNLAYGIRESAVNLDEAYAVAALLREAGAAVVMTRTGDQGLTESNRAAFCNTAEATILVSIHTNSVANPDPDGALALYYKPADQALAQALHAAMYAGLRPTAPAPAEFIDFGTRRFRAGVLRRSSMPAGLAEPVFLSDPGEAVALGVPIYTAPGSGVVSAACANLSCRRGQIARAIYQGVLAYFAG